MEKKKSKEKLDNMIIIMVKTYPYNLRFAFQRVAEVTGYKQQTVSNRWYHHVRYREQIYSLKSDFVEIKNSRSIKLNLMSKLLEIFQVKNHD